MALFAVMFAAMFAVIFQVRPRQLVGLVRPGVASGQTFVASSTIEQPSSSWYSYQGTSLASCY